MSELEPICKNCVFFSPESESDSITDVPGFGHCSNSKFQYIYIDGHRPTMDLAGVDSLLYWDTERHWANFTVGKNFGCVHFNDELESEQQKWIESKLEELKAGKWQLSDFHAWRASAQREFDLDSDEYRRNRNQLREVEWLVRAAEQLTDSKHE